MKLLFRQTPQGAFYCGSRMDAYDFPFCRSDTVFKAILNAWEMLYGEAERKKLIAAFLQTPAAKAPFHISSVFPVIGDIYFLPRPLSLQAASNGGFLSEMFQSICWISARVYQEWLQGSEISLSRESFISPGLYVHPQEIQSLPCGQKLWCELQRTRNRVDHKSGAVNIFQANQVYYAQELEQYLLIETSEYRDKLEAVFRLLAHEGMGGKRSIGCGSFLYQPPSELPESLEFIANSANGAFVTLSLYYPQLEDIKRGLLKHAHFELIERQGWNREQRQPRVRLFREGSHFQLEETTAVSLLEMELTASEKCYHYVHPFRIVAPGVQA